MEFRPIAANWGKRAAYANLFFCVIVILIQGTGSTCADETTPNPLHENTLVEKEPLPLTVPSSDVAKLTLKANRPLQQLDAIIESKVDIVEPIRVWATNTKTHLESFSRSLNERDYKGAENHRQQLEQLTIQLSTFRNTWNPLKLQDSPSEDPVRRREEYVPSPVALEEIQMGLERRLAIWKQVVRLLGGETYPISNHFGKGVDDLQRLQERTQTAQDYFLNEKKTLAKDRFVGELWSEHLEAKEFLVNLEACQKSIAHPNRRVAALVSTIPITMLVSFSDRANKVLAELDNSKQNSHQKRFLDVPAVAEWKKELHDWTSDTVSPLEFLAAVEQYETTGGTTDMETVERLANRLLVSKSASFRMLGRLATQINDGSTIKVYISQIFLNRLLPADEPEEGLFRDFVAGQPVSGQRRIEKNLELLLIPAHDRLLMSLDVKGKVHTATQANAFATTLLNRGYADYSAQKQIELTENGFRLLPSRVDVRNNRLELRGIRTTFDRIPVLSNVFRDIVRNQFASRIGGARAETGRKIASQARARLDGEAASKFTEFNERFNDGVHGTLKSLGLSLENSKSKTEKDWLLTSWKLEGDGVLSGNTPPPATKAGAFADLKLNEAALNAMIGKLEIGGKKMSVGDFRKQIATKFLRPEFAESQAEDEDVQIAFAERNPVVVRFADGEVEISVSIASLKVNKKTYRNFKGIVSYRPEEKDGNLLLVRDSSVSLVDVEPLVRTQFVLRAVFGKIFPANRPLVLSPKIFETDPRFIDFKTGHCRIENGWFAVALIAKE